MHSMGTVTAPIEARFWSKVDRRGPDDCWLWTANTTKAQDGYGLFYVTGRSAVVAHRWSYEQVHGPLDRHLVVDHLCRTRLCVNPAHLEAVDPRENVLRGIGPTAINAAKVVCIRGHDFAPAADGTRFCPTCRRATKREWEQRKKADPEYRERRREQERARYAERMKDPEFRAAQAAKQRAVQARRKERVGGS